MRILFIIAVSLISFAFARASINLYYYHKQLQDTQNGFGTTFREKHPCLYVYQKYGIPVVIIGFCINAILAAFASIYFLVRIAIAQVL